MLTIRDLTGVEEGLTDFKDLSRLRKVNGEKVLSLTLFPTKTNEHAFGIVEEESVITFDNEEYVIKKLSERGIGNTYVKRAEAIHKFFVDMINKQQPNIHNGSMTFAAFLSFVFADTGYTFSIIDSFYAQPFENLGNDNRLSLLQKGLERYKAEMEIVGKNVRFKKKIGNDTDFQFRYSHNIKAIEKNVDTTNLATVIKGTGAEGITVSYRSPNADIFGELDAPPVNDERFASQETLLDEMKARLQDTPDFSLTIDFTDLRSSGYPFTVPNEGDRVFVIYEPMNDLLIENRIMEINEVFNVELEPIQTQVTLANYKKTFAGTLLNNVQKRLRDIVNEDGIIKYNVLDEAVRLATEALKSAQTELEFSNGIIARDKDNPNLIVLYNSAGLGVSSDGGNTFPQAITGLGVNTDLLTAGQIHTNNIQIIGDDEFFYWDGNALQAYDANDPNKYVKLNSDGLYTAKGALTVERPDGFKLVNNGLANFDMNVQSGSPAYVDDVTFEDGSRVVTIDGPYVRAASSAYRRFDYLGFKHTARYLVVMLYARSGGNGASTYAQIRNENDVVLGTSMTSSTGDTDITITVDLGTPTGNYRHFYVYFKSTDNLQPARIRMATKYLSG